jgi:uncharacterized membrane protein
MAGRAHGDHERPYALRQRKAIMASDKAGLPTGAGIWFGLGLGGFFDGIVLHQILQWHHMLTIAGFPATASAT